MASKVVPWYMRGAMHITEQSCLLPKRKERMPLTRNVPSNAIATIEVMAPELPIPDAQPSHGVCLRRLKRIKNRGRSILYAPKARIKSRSLTLVSSSRVYLILNATSAPISMPIIIRYHGDMVILVKNIMKLKKPALRVFTKDPAVEANIIPLKKPAPYTWMSKTPPMKYSATKRSPRKPKTQYGFACQLADLDETSLLSSSMIPKYTTISTIMDSTKTVALPMRSQMNWPAIINA